MQLLVLAAAAAAREFKLIIEPADWDAMSACSYAMKLDDAPECDYVPAKLELPDGARHDGEVKRKGSSTWRDMDDKPSFKLKKLNDGTGVSLAQGWYLSEKVTFNNMVKGTGGVDAYRVFRDLGVAAPMSEHVQLALYRGTALKRRDTYHMLQTINDKSFMKHHFGDDYALYEVEFGVTEFKRAGGSLKGSSSLEAQATLDMIAAGPPLAQVNSTAMIAYATGEELVYHWDGACMQHINRGWPGKTRKQHNVYIARSNGVYTYIPHGLDRTFECRPYQPSKAQCALLSYSKKRHNCNLGPEIYGTCPAMVQCKQDTQCAAQYADLRARAEPHRRDEHKVCARRASFVWELVGVSIGITLAALLGIALLVWVAMKVYPKHAAKTISSPLL